jgi:hypothetical protein
LGNSFFEIRRYIWARDNAVIDRTAGIRKNLSSFVSSVFIVPSVIDRS